MRTTRIKVERGEVAEIAIKRNERVRDVQTGNASVIKVHGPAVVAVVISPKSK